jgi:hypothetical protein
VEIGVEDGTECNTRLLRENGWEAIQFDCVANYLVHQEYVTAENITEIFEDYDIPRDFDLLSIDIDSNDLWVWNALDESYTPRVVCIEYNAKIPPSDAKTVAYDPALVWDGSDYMGASLRALWLVGLKKGYSLMYCDNNGVNAFFLRDDLVGGTLTAKTPEEAFKPPQYGEHRYGAYTGHPSSPRHMVTVDTTTFNQGE